MKNIKSHIHYFTEENYRKLLSIAKENYKFIFYDQIDQQGNTVLWRHDIDLSVHRALRLAQIEEESGVKATYLINLHSRFYNWGEEIIINKILQIINLGHQIGLHFDLSCYRDRINSKNDLLSFLHWEKEILEKVFSQKIKVFSWHNPGLEEDRFEIDLDIMAGMINTYGKELNQIFGYCSDSNGYWRHDNLEDVLEQVKHKRLQVLTHPGWWQKIPLSPTNRINRCVKGRAEANKYYYGKILRKTKRVSF